MKRVWRWLFHLAAGVSLVLCLALSGLWIRSIWTGDSFYYVGSQVLDIKSETGLVRISISRTDIGDPSGWRFQSWPFGADYSGWRFMGRNWWDRLGFGHYVGGTVSGYRVDQYVFPHYFVVVVTALLPGLFLGLLLVRALFSRRRSRLGLCRTCGYDLRATPDRCPECGAVPQGVVSRK